MGTLFGILCIIAVAIFIALMFIPFFVVVGDDDFAEFLCIFVFIGLICIIIIGIIAIFIYMVVVFVKLMSLFIRSQVFERKIILLLNHIGVAFLVLAVISTVWDLGRTYLAAHLIDIEGLEVSYQYCIEWSNLLLGLVVLVITEILRQATTIKEEQDLTI